MSNRVASANDAYVRFCSQVSVVIWGIDTLSFYIKPAIRYNASANVATAPNMGHFLSADGE